MFTIFKMHPVTKGKAAPPRLNLPLYRFLCICCWFAYSRIQQTRMEWRMCGIYRSRHTSSSACLWLRVLPEYVHTSPLSHSLEIVLEICLVISQITA